MKSDLEELFLYWVRTAGLPQPEREYPFAAQLGRRFRFDFAWPEAKVYVEVEGGVWVRGRHNRPKGFNTDAEKYNLAALLGWRGLRFTTDMLKSAPVQCVEMVKELLSHG